MAKRQTKKYFFMHHFLPRKIERRRANLLSHSALFIYSLILLFLFGLRTYIPTVFPDVLGYASNIQVSDLLSETNKTRAKVGLKPLKINSSLSNAAYKKAKDMFNGGYWAHVSPEGTKPWDFILGENYDYLYAGENLAKNFSNSDDVVKAWYDSPSHRENLMNSSYEDVGYAVVNGKLNGHETTIVVQMFGKLRSPVQLAGAEDVPQSQIATPEVPAEALVELESPAEQTIVQPILQEISPVLVQNNEVDSSVIGKKSYLMNVKTVAIAISLTFGVFILFLLGIDMWYSKRVGLLKFTGHTLAHIAFLVIAVLGVMFSVYPGVIL